MRRSLPSATIVACAAAGLLGDLIGSTAAVPLTQWITSLAGAAGLDGPWLRVPPVHGVSLAVLEGQGARGRRSSSDLGHPGQRGAGWAARSRDSGR